MGCAVEIYRHGAWVTHRLISICSWKKACLVASPWTPGNMWRAQAEDVRANKPTMSIMYFDMNNFYSRAMFPWYVWYGRGREGTLRGHPGNDHRNAIQWKRECMIEDSLEYGKEMHHMHKDYPLTPECTKIESEQCPITRRGWNICPVKEFSSKPTRQGPLRYSLEEITTLHTRCEHQKIHLVMWFDQSPWMESYIPKIMELRKQANTIFKQVPVHLFGKIIENLLKYVNVKLVHAKEVDKLWCLITKKKKTFYWSTITMMTSQPFTYTRPDWYWIGQSPWIWGYETFPNRWHTIGTSISVWEARTTHLHSK